MQPIPKPHVLDPDRLLRGRGTQMTEDDRPRAELLDIALHESCAYAQQLWDHLNATRRYLLESLPPDPRAPGPHTTAAASPTGPDDEQGWDNWINAYSAVTSVLCGPHGDSGFGLSRAHEEAQIRRTAPVLAIHAEHPDSSASPETEADRRRKAAMPGPRDRAHTILTLGLALLALRGLRQRRRQHPRTGELDDHRTR